MCTHVHVHVCVCLLLTTYFMISGPTYPFLWTWPLLFKALCQEITSKDNGLCSSISSSEFFSQIIAFSSSNISIRGSFHLALLCSNQQAPGQPSTWSSSHQFMTRFETLTSNQESSIWIQQNLTRHQRLRIANWTTFSKISPSREWEINTTSP